MRFLTTFAAACYGVLHGFDRIRFRGTQQNISFPLAIDQFCYRANVTLNQFPEYAKTTSQRLCQQIETQARQRGLEPYYVPLTSTSKEDLAAKLARKAGRQDGLIAVLKALEPCRTFVVRKDPKLGRLALTPKDAKCLHYYHYWHDPVLGPCHVRMQTWFPFTLFVCVNGREMLAQRMTAEGMNFRQRDNCFSWIDDVARAQKLADEQRQILWSKELNRLLTASHPDWRDWPGMEGRDYYWSAEQTEWATDVMFRSRRVLKALMPTFIHHSLETLQSNHVMHFLGRYLHPDGTIHSQYQGEVGTDYTRRPEGVRVSFRADGNSVKFYDKRGSVLRVETTINDVSHYKSYRTSDRDPDGVKQWRPMKKGVSELPRRAEVSQASNERLLDSLASVVPSPTVAATLAKVSRRRTKRGVTVRALNVHGEDRALLLAVGRGESLVNGFRNRDIRQALGSGWTASAVSYRLRLLRHHEVIRKVTGTHRYLLTAKGQEVLASLTKAQEIQATEVNRETPP